MWVASGRGGAPSGSLDTDRNLIQAMPIQLASPAATLPRVRPSPSPPGTGGLPPRRPHLLASLDELAAVHPQLQVRELGEFGHAGDRFTLPKFSFRGPAGGGDLVRLGFFAGLHGDEPEGCLALGRFFAELLSQPALATGYELIAYPLCNPSGAEDGTRHSRSGHDLNREFWRGSMQPEVRLLERELGTQQFDGLIALHSDDTADGCYAFVRGATLTEALAKPALVAASAHLPTAPGEVIDGFRARDGLICESCYEGVLSNPRELHPNPFEIIFETPGRAGRAEQVAATVAALHSILREYRTLLATALNL